MKDPKDTAPGADASVAPMSRRQWVARMWWAVLAGALIFTSFPFRPIAASNLWPFAWFALVPLMLAVEGTRPKQAFWLGWLAGTVTNYGGFHWISGMLVDFGGFPPWLAHIGTILLSAYQGLALALICLCWRRLSPTDVHGNPKTMSIVRTAMVFSAIEFLFPLIFPWFFGNSQYRTLAAIQIADITGVAGITFVMVAFNASLYRAIRRFALGDRSTSWRAIGVGVSFTIATLIYGGIRIHQVGSDRAEAPSLKLGLVEADVGIWSKEQRNNPRIAPLNLRHSHLLRHHRLSKQLADQGVDLILWPESSYLPLDRIFIKRRPDFMLLATRDGQLAVWRDSRDPSSTVSRKPGDASLMGWTMLPTESPLGRPRAVASEREDAAVIVGDGGAAYFFDGKAVTPIATSTRQSLLGADIVPAGRIGPSTAYARTVIWAVGEAGLLMRGDRGRMDRISSGTTEHLRGIAMQTATRGWAVGDAGTIVTIRDEQLSIAPSPTSRGLKAVWVSSGQGFAVGDEGTVVRLATRGATLEKTPTNENLNAISGLADGSLTIAVGAKGAVIAKQANGSWKSERLGGEPVDLVAVAIDPWGRAVTLDERGGIYLRTPSGWETLDAPGIVGPVAVASLGWLAHVARLPRDVRYMRQSTASIPASDRAFLDHPETEWRLSEAERSGLQRDHQTPILFGGITSEIRSPPDPNWPYRDWNTAIMVDDDGRVVGLYDKVYLLVGGEFIPFGEQFPVVYEWIQHAGRFEAGQEVSVFHWRGFRLGVMICYEDILPKFNRRLAELEPHVILNVTNDAWFGHTAEPYLHLALSVFRSVEQRRALVRSTNTGVSAVIAPDGEIMAQTDITKQEVIAADVPMMTGTTIYGRVGDVFAWSQVGWLLSLFILPRLRRRTRPGRGAPSGQGASSAPRPRSKSRRKKPNTRV